MIFRFVPALASLLLFVAIPFANARDYVVKAGDTAAKIAKANGVGLPALAAANPGANFARLKVGQTLQIPETKNPGTPSVAPVSPEARMLRKSMTKAEVEARLKRLGASTVLMEVISTRPGDAPVFWSIPGRDEAIAPVYDENGLLNSIHVVRDTNEPKAYRHDYRTEAYLLPVK